MPEWILFFFIPIFTCLSFLLLGFYIYLIRGVSYREETNVFGRTAIVTGGNSGIGKEVVRDLARRGARVIIACRDKKKAFETIKEVAEETGSTQLDYVHLDLADLDSVRQFAANIIKNEERLDILINNAGIGYAPFGRLTKQGYHQCFGVNHFGPFLLTNLLLPLLKKRTPSRIVMVSSFANVWVQGPLDFTPGGATGPKYPNLNFYPESKLANILHARVLATRLQGTGVNVYTVHPGLVKTNIWESSNLMYGKWGQRFFKFLIRWCSQSPRMGAQTIIYCAVDPALAGTTGKFYFNCDESQRVFQSRHGSEESAQKLWEVSCLVTQSDVNTST